MNNERDILLKDWEKIEDDVIIKDVSTKGKNIDLCLYFLSRRNKLSDSETKKYFLEQAKKYVNRLLLNYQIYKAEHVLKNIDCNSNCIFYQISVETRDDKLRESLNQHLSKTIKNDAEHLQLSLLWQFYNLFKSNTDYVREVITYLHEKNITTIEKREIKKLTFDEFCDQSEKWRNIMAVNLFFKSKDPSIIELLDKYSVWNYLLKNELSSLLRNWIEIFYNVKNRETKECIIISNEENDFNLILFPLFKKWNIDDIMIDKLTTNKISEKETILNSLAKCGLFVSREKSEITKIIHRLFTTETMEINFKLVLKDNEKNSKLLLEYLVENRYLILLLEKEFCDLPRIEELRTTNKYFIKYSNEIDCLISSRELLKSHNTRDDLIALARKSADYIITLNKTFLEKNPLIWLWIEKDMDLMSNEALPLVERLPHLHNFLKILKEPVAKPSENLLTDMVYTLNSVDLKKLRQDYETSLPNFSNSRISQKYSKIIKFTYLNYIKQYRSAYAVFMFLVEQLQNYSKVTNQQIVNAGKNVVDLAVKNYEDQELISHCLAFLEMLQIDTSSLRAFLLCLNLTKGESTGHNFLFQFEEALKKRISAGELQKKRIFKYLEAAKIVCDQMDVPVPKQYLTTLAQDDNWFEFILNAQFLNYSQKELREICLNNFKNVNLGKNLFCAILCAVQDTTESTLKRKFSLTKKQRRSLQKNDGNMGNSDNLTTSTSSTATAAADILEFNSISKFLSPDLHTDLFATILLCTSDAPLQNDLILDFDKFKNILLTNESLHNSSTFVNLMKNAFTRKWPVLSVLAAIISHSDNLIYNWLTWLIISTDYPMQKRKPSNANEVINCVNTLAKDVIVNSVHKGYVQMLHMSIMIFFPESQLRYLTEYLLKTYKNDFTDSTTKLLQEFLIEVNTSMDDKLIKFEKKTELMDFIIKLILLHLANNFTSLEYQKYYLSSLCQSEIGYFNSIIDFELIRSLCTIIEFTEINLDFNMYLDDKCNMKTVYKNIYKSLLRNKHYEKAIQFTDLLNLSKSDVIYEYWMDSYERTKVMTYDTYEKELARNNLQPDLLINFYIHVADELLYTDVKKYELLKRSLDIIKINKLYPSEEFDRDKLEFELVLCYVQLTEESERTGCEVYHSFFYEHYIKPKMGVIYDEFFDLRIEAGIDELTISGRNLDTSDEIGRLEELIHLLLDRGDIIQALRYWTMFDHAPMDLRYLVFSMAVAENPTKLYDLSQEERLFFNDDIKETSNLFNKRTLRSNRKSQVLASDSVSSSPVHPNSLDASENSVGINFDFEEIPSRERQDIFDTIKGIASRMKHGTKISQRIVLTYRAAMYLDKEYNEVLKIRDPLVLLNDVIKEDCLNKLVVISDIMVSTQMSPEEIADFLATQIAMSIINSRFYLFQNTMSSASNTQLNQMQNQGQNIDLLWGFDLNKDFHLFLELCPRTILLGNCLLHYVEAIKIYRNPEKYDIKDDSHVQLMKTYRKLRTILNDQVLSHKKQNTMNVEFLIKAHDCFVHECSMEGIANVLQKAKALNVVLANAKSWNLIVKMLIGIQRYREMHYCFETLIMNDQFESLLGQFDEKNTNGLKNAIIAYLNEYCPENTEYFRLAALHFRMYKELAQIWETEAKSNIAKNLSEFEFQVNKTDFGKIPFIKISAKLLNDLSLSLDGYTHATENYLLDNKLNLAQKSVSNAELIAMQINLVRTAMEKSFNDAISVLNIRTSEIFRYCVNYELSVPQALILERAYAAYKINWTEAIYIHYINQGNESYLADFTDRMELTDNIIENLVKSFQLEIKANITDKKEKAISNIIELTPRTTLKYKLASILGLKRIINDLINDQNLYYLKDTDYGRNDII